MSCAVKNQDTPEPITAVVEAMGDEKSIRAFRLTVTAGPDTGVEYQSDGERIVIGSHETADLVLSDRTVSRFHCELLCDEHGVQLRDLDSRNGVRVGSLLVRTALLDGPVTLALGQSEIRFEQVADPVVVPIAPDERLGDLVGSSAAMRAAFALMKRAARTRANILVEGEPGVGKLRAAAAIHEASERADGPLTTVDCTLPEQALRRELFGQGDEPGALEQASGGTVVLVDLGALGAVAQTELLRALDDRAVRRVDGGLKRDIDVRVIATSRRNLRRDVNANRLKAQLYSMIAVLRVRIPPLRERLGDIPLLVADISRAQGATDSVAAAALMTGESIESMRRYSWPDNLRELETYVRRCLTMEQVLATPDTPNADGPPGIDPNIGLKIAREEWVRYFEYRYLSALLESTGQNVSAAARKAGIDRVHLHRLLRNVGLRGKRP